MTIPAARRPTVRKSLADTPIDRLTFDLLSLTMAMVLGLHATHLPWWLSIVLALMLGWRWWQRRGHAGRVPRWLKLPLLALLTLAVMAYYGNIFGRAPGTALAVGLLILKLLETETARDVRVGVSFACFALMAALLFDQSLTTTIAVGLGLLPALATLRSLEPAQSARNLPRTLLPELALLAISLPLTLLAFVLIPRLNTPLWGAPSPESSHTGLSDSMSPGNFSRLLVDDSPAMRVSFEGQPPATSLRYFRAYVMWDYDGRSWHHAASRHPRSRAPEPVQAGTSIRYRISLEPTRQRVLPALDVPLRAPAQAHLLAGHELRADKPVNALRDYRLRSALHYRLQPVLDARSRQLGLRLPAGFNPRTRQLAERWRQRYGDNDAAIVQAALALFHDGGFRYTLTPDELGRNAMDDFLFTTHEGFCEHYASAFTVLMRDAGIPARVVTGYQGGFWNRLGHYLLVRNSDAHAWGEVWLAGRGWIRVDPTAAVRPERVTRGAAAVAGGQSTWYGGHWLQGLRNRWDVVNRWWGQAVMGFDALRQRGLLTSFGVRDTDASMLGILLAAGSVLFILIGLAWALLWRRERPDPVSATLRRLERKLARRGIARRHGEGPQHYLRRAARALPQQRHELENLMHCYLDLRYAHDTPPPESAHRFSRAVRDFQPAVVVK